ncbi:MAG: radical SAM protein [Candidatus Omnitrophota bacterium]|nr:MAG: radical SAM protein [Candidatus Omnitrophota bacterium]
MRSRVPSRVLLRAFTQTPELISPIAKMFYRKHIGVEGDYRRSNGIVCHPPRQISLRITNLCNHRCAVCGQYGTRGYMHREKGKDLLKVLPYTRYKELVEQMAQYRPIYYVTGGEPFLYPDFVKLMNYIKQRGSVVSIVTNGVKLKECAEEIVRNNWDMILVSFDGPEDVHDRCRGLRGAYRTAVDGLLELREQKKRQRRKKPYILTSLTLSPMNVDYIEETFQLNKDIYPDLMVIYLSWFTSSYIGNSQKTILKEKLGTDAYTWQSYAKSFTPQEAQSFADSLDRARKKQWSFDYLVVPDLKGNDVKDYYLCPEKMFGYGKCAAPFIMVDIMPNGDVTTCRDFIDVKVGNITENDLLSIWNNEKFVAFRKLLIEKGGLLPQCSRCCGLMGF